MTSGMSGSSLCLLPHAAPKTPESVASALFSISSEVPLSVYSEEGFEVE
jgi:hypothetical protein